MEAFGTYLWDRLYYLYLAVAVIIGVLIIAWLCTSLVRFRARPGSKKPTDAPRAGVIPAERGHVGVIWLMVVVIALILAVLAFNSIEAIDVVEHPPANEFAIYHNVTGFQFGWKVNYSGEGGIPFTLIGDYYIPVETNIVMNVTSQDVWHNFAVPDFRIRVDAIPGNINHMWFKATQLGDTRIQCVMLCGNGHAGMISTLHAMTANDYAAWYHNESVTQYQKFVKSPRGTTIVNATFDGVTLSVSSNNVTAAKPLIVQLNNTGPQSATFLLHTDAAQQEFTVPPGQAGYAWFLAPAGGLVLFDGPNTSNNLQVVS
jgi:cytochrome c oxidase subunit 2